MGLNAKHGIYDRRVRKGRALDDPLVVRVLDNTEAGLNDDEIDQVVIAAAEQSVFFNDLSCRHWMFDFRAAGGHWCKGEFPEVDGFQQLNPLQVNVYE